MQVTGTRQQEAWRRRELPPVEQVAGGVWSVPVPVIGNPVRYVLSYVLEHDAGVVLVDPGWNDAVSWQALVDGLAACGVPLDAVTAVLITHSHPDHHGLSGAVREKSGAWIGMHEREDALLGAHQSSARSPAASAYLRWCGVPAEHVAQVAGSSWARGLAAMPRADRLLASGDLIDVAGLRLRAVWTPGHSPGHLCFYDETRELLLTGDHVLPRITPNISAFDLSAESPLRQYLDSLADLAELRPREVLPAHEYRFAGLDSRLDALRAHHAERLGEAVAILRAQDGGQSAWRVAEQVSWAHGWAELAPLQRQIALGEVVAHLRHLQSLGAADWAAADGVGLWRNGPAMSLRS
jgi:glyoxylase-like metal-dependent hydrolase (beta-lactamase superfamily II)